jgi:hypothetical protein
MLALFRCMQEGLQPDSPSRGNVINRVEQILTSGYLRVSGARPVGQDLEIDTAVDTKETISEMK